MHGMHARAMIMLGLPAAALLLQLAIAAAPAEGVATPCHEAQLRYCNSTAAPLAGKGAACIACEATHAKQLSAAGCGADRADKSSKLYRFCFGPSPPGPPRPHPSPPPNGPPSTKDCPTGPDHPCHEPATPKIAAGYASSNLFWPGEQDAEGRVYTCTYCPMVTLVNRTRLVAVGGCTPSGCPGCNGIHVSDASGREGATAEARAASGSACGVGCIKTSDDGGLSWTKIRNFTPLSPGGMINTDRRTGHVLLQFPLRTDQNFTNGGSSHGP